MRRLAGKTAIVTGATSGMGRAIAVLFARARAALFLASDDSAWMTGTALTLDGGILTGA